MRGAGLAFPLTVLLLAGAPARADVTCLPGDYSAPGANAYPGSAQRYRGGLPGMQETVGARTAVPSTWQTIPGNPNCFVTPHAALANGGRCKADRDCPDKRCRLFPDGDKYCLAGHKACTLPGGDGAPGGAVIAMHQQCYECAAGAGWKLCGEAGKRVLHGDQEGVVLREPADETGREDWRDRAPDTDHYRDTDRPTGAGANR
jgi:hypothetical protein